MCSDDDLVCSRGSKWLDFDGFRIFLEELAWRKRLNIAYVVDKLEFTGSETEINRKAVRPIRLEKQSHSCNAEETLPLYFQFNSANAIGYSGKHYPTNARLP